MSSFIELNFFKLNMKGEVGELAILNFLKMVFYCKGKSILQDHNLRGNLSDLCGKNYNVHFFERSFLLLLQQPFYMKDD